jgi:transcriptional regulator with XRE-family HTH domain
MDDFVVWLNAEMKKRGWSLRQAARRVGVSYTAFADIADGQARPNADLCQRIALVFQIPPEEVFCLAGLLPLRLNEMLALGETVHLFNKFSPGQ